ncbi:aminopeptidase P family protein [Paraflavisolibacter sp. H34]|uniref:aminopeptidase P family protein n=1 Tax=Huijunlia imazamoxiresistens TaxID=3127457 RepID=UPI0030165CEC
MYKERLTAIRALLKENQVAACILPSSDPHLSEYLPEHYRAVRFASGFTGSAGTLVITQGFAGLWTDSRYFTQAESQLEGTGYELVQLKVPHTPEYIAWLAEHLPAGATVAVDFRLLSVQLGLQLKEQLERRQLQLADQDLMSLLWENRPPLPSAPAFLLPEEACGKTIAEKLQQLRSALDRSGCSHHLVSTLDDVAWLCNLRGQDVAYNPVVTSFVLLDRQEAALFIDKEKIDPATEQALAANGLAVLPYTGIVPTIAQLPGDATVLLDDRRTNYKLYTLLPATTRVRLETNPTTVAKAVKNEVELRHFRQCMITDGLALTRFFKWLEDFLGKEKITEISAADKALWFREQHQNFAGPSFASISGYQASAALPHYHPEPETEAELQPRGLYLLDSGGQYRYGTTDITRTVSLGENSLEEKRDYTLVLSALLAGSSARFPKGTKGYQVDALVRAPLWEQGINYGHGTGHGIGYFLNVHEGPQNIGPAPQPVALEPGMITSIEPGIYRPGKHGVRIENLVLTVNSDATEFGEFLSFETLTLAPIDTRPVLPDLLPEAHRQWLNAYHERVYHSLSPYLDAEEARWLQQKCRPI